MMFIIKFIIDSITKDIFALYKIDTAVKDITVQYFQNIDS